jgi:hypothetical protein
MSSGFSKILTGVLIPVFLFAQEFLEEKQQEDDLEKIKAFIEKNYRTIKPQIQIGSNGKIRLTGKYKTYDEFLYSLMALQIAAIQTGVDLRKIDLSYDSVETMIINNTPELCFPYAVKGNPCPYGRISFSKPYVEKEVKRKEKGRYALVLGVSKFKSQNIPPVDGADNDARAFAKYLEDRGYKVKLLIDEKASLSEVEKALKEIYSEIQDGDELVFFAASHGAPVDEKGEVGIVLYDSQAIGRNCKVDIREPVVYEDTALKMCALVKNAFSVKNHLIDYFADKKINLVVITDACYSGDLLRSYLKDLKNPVEVATTEEYERRLREAPNISIMATASSGNRRSWGGVVDGDFKNRLISVGTPRYIASQPAQGQKNAHGVFTAFLITALPQSGDSLAKAFEKIKDDVNDVSRQMCLTARGVEGRDIVLSGAEKRIVGCPPDGQQPQLFRIRAEDYVFAKAEQKADKPVDRYDKMD